MAFYPTYTDIYTRAVKNIEYHYGRESPQYLRYLEALNKHREYSNKKIVNDLLDSLGVKTLRGYYFRIYSKSQALDINNNSFTYWFESSVYLMFPFQVVCKNLGIYEKFEFSQLGAYDRTIIKPSLDTSFEFSSNKSFLNDYTEELDIFHSTENLPDNREFVILYPFESSKISFDFGTFISLPTYSFYELAKTKRITGEFWENGVRYFEYEYFDRHIFKNFDSVLNVENQLLFFKPNPNYDYEYTLQELYKFKIQYYEQPKKKKCCLLNCKKKIN